MLLISNLFTGLVFAFEILLYVVLGVNIFPRQQINGNNNLISYEPPQPGYLAPSSASSASSSSATNTDPLTKCTSDSCAACIDVTSTGGTIQSPNYPNDYGNGKSCTYTIEVPTGKKVKLILSSGAQIDVVSAFEELNFVEGVFPPTPTTFGSASGPFPTTTAKEFVTTSSNKVQIVFSSDSTACSNSPCKWEVKYVAV